MEILDTGIRDVRNVSRYSIGRGSISQLPGHLSPIREKHKQPVLFFIDEYFEKNQKSLSSLERSEGDLTIFVSTIEEPTTEYVDFIADSIRKKIPSKPSAIVGMGGGITMDIAKAVSNLLTNGGCAEDYQGWDLVRVPGVYKIAIPTLSGTGAEATRTCVMTNKRTGLKLGMNSDFTVYDRVIMDTDLTATVPRDQYFFTGSDAYIHCMEALAGSYRNAIGDAFSREVISLCKEIFLEGDMMDASNRERMMVASFLGGCAIATSYVGVVHPFSAALSVVLGLHHCVSNCIVMRAMAPFYPRQYDEFWSMVEKQGISIPKGVCQEMSSEQYDQLFNATIIHTKPLTNALGKDFKNILTKDRVISLFMEM